MFNGKALKRTSLEFPSECIGSYILLYMQTKGGKQEDHMHVQHVLHEAKKMKEYERTEGKQDMCTRHVARGTAEDRVMEVK